MAERTSKFVKNKETKNTVRYSEIAGNEDFIMKEVYIQKTAFEGEIPSEIDITISY